MPKDRSLVRASDIGSWAFCRRAWWFKNVVDAEHERPDLLERGNIMHEAHGQRLSNASHAQTIGLIVLALGGIFVLVVLVMTLF